MSRFWPTHFSSWLLNAQIPGTGLSFTGKGRDLVKKRAKRLTKILKSMLLSISYKQKLSNLWINCYSIPNWWEDLAYGNGLPGPPLGTWCSAMLQTGSLLHATPGMNSLVPGKPGARSSSWSTCWTCAEFMPWTCSCPMGTGISVFHTLQVWKLEQEWAEISGEQLKLWLWSLWPGRAFSYNKTDAF